MTEWIYDPRAGRCRKTDGGQAVSDIDDCRKFVENLTRDRGEVMRAGDDKIAEIRERHAQSDNNYIEFESTWDIHADRATLLAEVDRQRAEIKRLRAEMQSAKADAWDEGYQDHQEMIVGIARKISNPYR